MRPAVTFTYFEASIKYALKIFRFFNTLLGHKLTLPPLLSSTSIMSALGHAYPLSVGRT